MSTKVSYRLLVAFVALMVVLTACGGAKSLKDQIVGKWSAEQDGTTMTFDFQKDGKVGVEVAGISLEATYTWTDDNSIEIVMEAFGSSETIAGDVEINGDVLKITVDGEAQEFTKVK